MPGARREPAPGGWDAVRARRIPLRARIGRMARRSSSSRVPPDLSDLQGDDYGEPPPTTSLADWLSFAVGSFRRRRILSIVVFAAGLATDHRLLRAGSPDVPGRDQDPRPAAARRSLRRALGRQGRPAHADGRGADPPPREPPRPGQAGRADGVAGRRTDAGGPPPGPGPLQARARPRPGHRRPARRDGDPPRQGARGDGHRRDHQDLHQVAGPGPGLPDRRGSAAELPRGPPDAGDHRHRRGHRAPPVPARRAPRPARPGGVQEGRLPPG